MKSKHTSGPWTFQTWDATGGDSSDLVTAGAIDVAEVFTLLNDRSPGVDEGFANGRLIAAAPDLLAGLIQAVEESGHSLSGPTDSRVTDAPKWVCNARLLIARATFGKSPSVGRA